MLETIEGKCDINPPLLPFPKSMFSSLFPFYKCMSHFILFFFSSSSVEGLFLFPDGSNSGLQQPVYEPAWSSWSCFYARQHEPSQHGSRNDTFQHERATHGHEPASASWNEPLQHPWAEDASAGLPRPTPPVFAYTRHKETIPRRGNKRNDPLWTLFLWLQVATYWVRCCAYPSKIGASLFQPW